MKQNIIEDIIFDKLSAPVEAAAPVTVEPECVSAPEVLVPVQVPDAGSGIDWNYAELCQTELGERVAAMDSLRESHGQLPDGRGLRRFIKRLWRKLCGWYVEPTFARQSAFNASATPAVGRMAELHSLYGEGLKQMEQQFIQQKQYDQFLQSEQFSQNNRLDHAESRLERLERVQIRELQLRCDALESNGVRVDVLETQNEELARRCDDLASRCIRLAERCDALESSVSRFAERYDALESSVSRFAERYDALESSVSRFAERCDALESSVSRFAERCDALESSVSRFAERCVQMEDLQRVTAAAAADAARQLQRLRELDVGLGSPFADERSGDHHCSQTGEDRILFHIFRELGYRDEQCSYLDLGANHAKFLSNTWHFYTRGARGVLVEANPALIGELKLFRSGDVILNRCVSEKSGEAMDFYILSGDGLSTPDRAGAEAAIAENPALSIERTVRVESISVNELMDTYFDGAPLLLSLDIEGKEMEILQSIDFEKHRPLAVVIEMIPYRSNLYVGERSREILAFMAERGYQEYAFTGINSIFLDSRQLGRASI